MRPQPPLVVETVACSLRINPPANTIGEKSLNKTMIDDQKTLKTTIYKVAKCAARLLLLMFGCCWH